MVFDFVILGGGAAAYHAAAEFARLGRKYTIVLVSREAFPPCYPKSMVQKLAENQDIFDSLLATEKWFLDNNVALSLNTNVTQMDAKKRLLVGERFDPSTNQSVPLQIKARSALILATGASPIVGPPLEVLDDTPLVAPRSEFGYPLVHGLFTLRTFAGGLAINRHLQLATNVVVVGGGFLGLDMAYIARRRGVDTTIVGGNQLLERVFTPGMASIYQNFFESNGVTVITKNRCSNILVREGRVVGVTLQDGSRISCDMVMVACGVVPNVELFRDQLKLEKGTNTPGVLVDPYLLTSVPGVYAIGDVCAMRYSQHNPGAIRHLSHAQASGTSVARMLVSALDAGDRSTRRRGSKVVLSKAGGSARSTIQDRMMDALVPGSSAEPYTPHPAYDVNHFNFLGRVSGDRLGPDFLMVGHDMGPGNKMLTLWLWENRIVGAFISNPTEPERQLLDEATSNQWYVINLPEIRAMTDALEALEHIKKFHKL